MELQGKKVLVFGSGKSGIGASDLLAKVGAFPVIYDGNAETDKDAVVHKTDGTYPVTVYAGELPKEVQDSLDLVVLSPGVPTDLPLVKSFYEQGLPVWGEVELAYRVGDGEVLAITGTNGKTTTTALLGKIMQDARESVFVVGNIGTPYTSKALEMKPNSITVAEISSFQLETIDEFAPKVSAILNIWSWQERSVTPVSGPGQRAWMEISWKRISWPASMRGSAGRQSTRPVPWP